MLRIGTLSYPLFTILFFSSILIRGAHTIERRGFWINFTPFRVLKQQQSQQREEEEEMVVVMVEEEPRRRRRSFSISSTTTSTTTTDGLMGSKPPKCESKCGNCNPCTPIRVPVQPGPHMASEYYPEAWRCKCNGKLFMP